MYITFFEKCLNCFPKRLYPFPSTVFEGSIFSTSSPTLGFIIFLFFLILAVLRVCSGTCPVVALICIFLMTHVVEYLLMCLFAICVSLAKCSIFARLLLGYFWLVLSFHSVLYILHTSFVSYIFCKRLLPVCSLSSLFYKCLLKISFFLFMKFVLFVSYLKSFPNPQSVRLLLHMSHINIDSLIISKNHHGLSYHLVFFWLCR